MRDLKMLGAVLLAACALIHTTGCALLCSPDAGYYCDGPASVTETLLTTGQPGTSQPEADCRPGRWAFRGGNLLAVAEPLPYRPGIPCYLDSILGPVDNYTLVEAQQTDGRWVGTLASVVIGDPYASSVQPISDVTFDPNNPTQLSVTAAGGGWTTTLKIDAPATDDFDGVRQRIDSVRQAAGG